jgi:CubicO group peptidase (beta-lactamase class C family)
VVTDDARSPARREAAFAPEASVTAYLQEKLWDALGMEYAGSWSINRGQDGLEKMESGVNPRAIDFAKFGRLMLNDGRWRGSKS